MAEKTSAPVTETVDDVVADVLAAPERYLNRFGGDPDTLAERVKAEMVRGGMPFLNPVPDNVGVHQDAVAAVPPPEPGSPAAQAQAVQKQAAPAKAEEPKAE